jgi:hypothetical protein
MNRALRFLAVPSVTLALALAATAQPEAQAGSPAPGSAPAVQPTGRPAKVAERPADPLVDVDFGGGTFGEFAQLLQSSLKPAPNIVLMPEIETARIGKLSLKQITVISALRAAVTAAEEPDVSRRWEVTTDAISGQNALYRVGIDYNRFPQPTPSARVPARVLEVFPVRESLGSPETMLSAIEGAVGMLDDRNPPKISFHPESGLLFVSGTRAHIEAVIAVMEAMENRANSSRNGIEIGTARRIIEAIGEPNPTAALQAFTQLKEKASRLNQSEMELARFRATSDARLEVMSREMDDLKARTMMQLAEAEKEIQRLRSEKADVEMKMRDLAAQVKMLRDQADAARPK